MVKLVHNVTLSVFAKGEYERELAVLSSVLPVDYEKEKLDVKIEKAEGFEHEIIHILSLRFSKSRLIKLFLDKLFSSLDACSVFQIISEKEKRIDDEGCLFIRLDKQSFLDGQWVFTDSGDCFHCRIKLAAYPKNKKNALQVFDSLCSAFNISNK